jgi:NCS2 family nucleobase:cation symporter-2
LSIAAGLLTAVDFYAVADAAWIGLPHYPDMWQFSFRWTLLPAFVIVSICGALKSFGNLVLCEKANDEEWSEPDIRRVGDGLTADGLAVFTSGLLGGVASDTSASNVALSIATGATSRWIGFGAGGLFLLLGFSPKLSAILSVMPASVAGAILVFVVCFMMMAGIQIILSSRMDIPKTFVMGVALTFGISLDVIPALYAQVYPWLRPLFESSLTLSTVVAVLLNQLLRLGGKKAGATGETPSEV